MQLQYRKNPDTRSNCWKRTSPDGRRQNQGSKRVEDTDQSQKSGEFSGICKFLQKIHQKL